MSDEFASQFPSNYPINGCFVVRNIITNSNKTIRIFDYPIPVGTTRDLLRVPGVSESDIRASLLKGELRNKLIAREIDIICSDIDLIQFNDIQKSFLMNAGVITGLNGGSGTGGFDVQDDSLIGIQNSVNAIFTTHDKFKHAGQFKEVIFVNGLRNHIPEDYSIMESGGPGTGYDTVIFTDPPLVDDLITIDYFKS
jgi:hypothetical protein